MSDLLYTWQLLVTAGTPSATPATTSLLVPASVVEVIEIMVPPGPHGTLGWQLWYGGGQLFPYNAGTWLVADDDTIKYVPAISYDGGAWSLKAYNSGTYDHTLYITTRLRALAALPVTVSSEQALIIG